MNVKIVNRQRGGKSLKNRRSLRKSRNSRRRTSRTRSSRTKKSKGIMAQIGGFVRDLSVQAFRTGPKN